MSLTELRTTGPLFDGYESVAELLDWVQEPEAITGRAARLTTAIRRSVGFRNFYQYMVNGDNHLAGFEGIIVRRSNEYRWGSTPSMQFWEDIYDTNGWIAATGRKRAQLVQQLEETWGPEQKLILDVIAGKFELSSRVIPLFTKGSIKV